MEIPCVLFVDCHEKMCENILKGLFQFFQTRKNVLLKMPTFKIESFITFIQI